MKPQFTSVFVFAMLSIFLLSDAAIAQTRRLAVIGSSTAAGLATSHPDSAWVRRVSYYYKNQLGILDTAYNLGVSGTNLYHGMPTSSTPPAGRPSPDVTHNVTEAVRLLATTTPATNGVVIINYPSGGYDTYTIPEIMTALQTIYDSATRTGNRAFVTTTQPRLDGSFSSSAIKRKMADIKDSIIKRFGLPNTLNFWDGMYNPADTTFLAAYASGDNVHFNNAGHRVLFQRVRDKNIFGLPAQEYRSNVASTGLWNDPNTWQVYNGTTWVTATVPPSLSSGKVTIQSGDSIRINSYAEIDQVVVESGAILAIFNTSAPTVFMLNDGTGPDIENNGKLYVSINATLSGTGNIQNNAGGTLIIRNQGNLAAPAINNGITTVSGTGNISNAVFTNNKTFLLTEFTLNLNNATFVNNDSFAITAAANTFFASKGNGIFNNAASGVVFRTSTSGITRSTDTVTVNNSGRFAGFGEFNIQRTGVNNGRISPGNSPGILRVNPGFVSGKSPTLTMEISSTGAVAGTNYDQLAFSTAGGANVNVTGTTLNLTDQSSDPVGTTYTLLSIPGGTITGPFAATNLPAGFGNLTISGNTLTVEKIAVLPVTWAGFTATARNNNVMLNWSTHTEINTDKFIVEHSINGSHFKQIGVVAAKGNSSTLSTYQVEHTSPVSDGKNFYRLRQLDLDGKESFSEIRQVQFRQGQAEPFVIAPNPARNIVQVFVHAPGIRLVIAGINGKIYKRLQLAAGNNSVDISDLPSGIYQVISYDQENKMKAISLVKQ